MHVVNGGLRLFERHQGPKLCVDIGCLLACKLATLDSEFPDTDVSVFDQAPATVELLFEDPGRPSALQESVPELSSLAFMFFLNLDLLFWNHIFTWVCVRPRNAANSALSGRAKYCVFWKRLVNSRS